MYTSGLRPPPQSSFSAGAGAGAASRRSSGPSSTPNRSKSLPATAREQLPPPVNDRKALLNKMFPRVCGVSGGTDSSSGKGPSKSPSARTAGGATKKPTTGAAAASNEGHREVVAWLRSLEVDMSEYAPAFFENGFDSIKLLGNVEAADLPGLIPKKGHHRLIQQALDDLTRKHRTAAAGARPQSGRRDARHLAAGKRRGAYSDDEHDSDDSFVVSDDDEYRPGMISGMFRKNRKRSYSIDSVDSYNMEASYDEIQHEEERRCVGEWSVSYMSGV